MRLFVAPSVFCLVRRGRRAEKFSQTDNRLCTTSRFLLARKQQTLGDQKTMKKAKSVIAFVFLVVLCVSVASVEYDPVMRFGSCLTFPSAFSLYSCYWAHYFEPPKVTKMRMGFILVR